MAGSYRTYRRRNRRNAASVILTGIIAVLCLTLMTLLTMLFLSERRRQAEEDKVRMLLSAESLDSGSEHILNEIINAEAPVPVSDTALAKKQTDTNMDQVQKAPEEPENVVPSYTEAEVQKMIDEALPGIVCWGDSITYGYLSDGTSYPATLQGLIDRELVDPIRELYGYGDLKCPAVLNYGVSAESTTEILGRIGNNPYSITGAVTLPGGKGAEVNVDIADYRGDSSIRPIKDVEPHNGGKDYRFAINPVSVGGVKCNLERYYDTSADRSRYKLVRVDDGPETVLEAGTGIISASAGAYKSYISIVMMGANGGYAFDGGSDLSSQFRDAVKGHSRFLCIGMGQENTYTQSAELQPDYANKLRADLGANFLSIQELLSGDVNSHVPSALLNGDGLHYTPEGYRYIGEQVYRKLDELGYFNELKALAVRE